MRTYLGIDGGGTKTDFLLIDATGRPLAAHRAGSAYYPETGIEALEAMLVQGIEATLQRAGVAMSDVAYAFIGLPAYGEDSRLLTRLDRVADTALAGVRYRCGNDMVCGWAGALAGQDGISVVAGTGSIAYGEYDGRSARAGGWGELFSDEGSAFWLVREALTAFSRMSDGRAAKGALYGLIRDHFRLSGDLDVCGAVYGPPALPRSELAALAPLVLQAARAGDPAAQQLFARAAQELAALIHAVRSQLGVPDATALPVSCSGGMVSPDGLLQPLLAAALTGGRLRYDWVTPKLPPVAGAVIYSAKLGGVTATPGFLARLGAAI
jgi:N-acetylglucosamine kinase-like BadF-type ATPase